MVYFTFNLLEKMKFIKFYMVGILFGIILSKGEIISWYRIYEMFKFQAFHMYGVIGSAILIGMIFMWLFRRRVIKTFQGNPIFIAPKKRHFYSNLLGGILFGFGWALAGSCPGPMFVLLGKGIFSIAVVIFGGVLGAFFFGVFSRVLSR